MKPLRPCLLSISWTLGLSVVSGLLLGLAQAPLSLGLVGILGVALVTWLAASQPPRRSLLVGAVSGLSLNTFTLHWVGVLGIPVAIGLIGFMTLWALVLCFGLSRITRLRWWPLWAPAWWVAVETAAGTVPFGGFPWLRLAYTSVNTPLSGWLWVLGSAGVTYLVATCGMLVLLAALRRRRAIALVTLIALHLAGLGLLAWPISTPEKVVRVGMVQGNVNRDEHGTSTYARSVTANHLSETVFLLAEQRAIDSPPADFIVWPENSTDDDPTQSDITRDSIELASQLAGTPMLVGVLMMDKPNARQTSSLWWDPGANIRSRYDKRNLVPFGEWIPFREFLLPRFPILKQVGLQSVPGTTPGVMEGSTLRYPTLRVGSIICFELAWDATSYDTVRHGAEIVISQSNTNTYAGTFEPAQQMVLNQVRALETRREVMAATLNGWSGMATPRGAIVGSTREMTAAHRMFEMPLRTAVTPAVRMYPWLTYALSAWGTLAFLIGLFRRQCSSN